MSDPDIPAPPRPTPPRLLAISDRRTLPERDDLAAWLHRLAGVDVPMPLTPGSLAVQLREKDLPDADLLRHARRARARFPPPRRLLINGRADVALAAGADGVHLPFAGLPAPPLRALWRRRGDRPPLLGRSTHRVEEVEAARDEGVDYVTFGPVYPTPSKARYGPPPGVEGLHRACAVGREGGLPVIALGGVDGDRVAEVMAAGAWGAAGIRVFQSSAGCAAMVQAMAAALAARSDTPADADAGTMRPA